MNIKTAWQNLVERWSNNTKMRPFQTGKHYKGTTKSPTWRIQLLAKRKNERQARKRNRK